MKNHQDIQLFEAQVANSVNSPARLKRCLLSVHAREYDFDMNVNVKENLEKITISEKVVS